MQRSRRSFLKLQRLPGESFDSYINRASFYRTEMLSEDETIAVGEAFYCGFLLDQAALTKDDLAMVQSAAGCDNNELKI
eukprot:10581338-Heterocapsa_arctica.AAC.1